MNTPDQRIIELIDYLIYKKKVRSSADFSDQIGILNQTVSKIRKGKNHFTVGQIENICKIYDINANWIFGLSDKLYNNSDEVLPI